MKREFDLIRRKVLGAAWRRKTLILTAFVAMSVISVVASEVIPKTYQARTLMLLQENARSSILQDPTRIAPDLMAERVGGLQALLHSEHVLKKALQDYAPRQSQDPLWLAGEMATLRRTVTLQLEGSDFLEIQLREGFAEGLSRKLEIITTRFLEALMPDQKGTTAIQILVAKRQDEVNQAEARLARLKGDGRGLGASGPEATITVAQAEAELAAAREAFTALSKRASAASGGRSNSILNAPEKILVIDPPHDPTAPVISQMTFMLAGIAAGLLLGIGLAAAAEMLDPVVRYEDDLGAIAGVPVLASLPHVWMPRRVRIGHKAATRAQKISVPPLGRISSPGG